MTGWEPSYGAALLATCAPGLGVILILVGLAMITGQLTAFAYRPLATFPALGKLG